MTTKHSDLYSRKGKKNHHSPKTDTLPTSSKNMIAHNSKGSSYVVKPPSSVGLFDQQIKKQKKKKSKSRARKLISLSIVAYLTYTSLYTCGSPFDQNTEKPAICSAIDPIKLDLYSLYQSKYYKTNIDPYVSPVVNKGLEIYHEYGVPAYHDYAIPAQVKLNEFYWNQAKPNYDRGLDGAFTVYNKHVHPIYTKNIAPVIKPYVDQAQPHINQAKSYVSQAHPYYLNQVKPLYYQAKEKAFQIQEFIQQKYNDLPPSVKQTELDIRNKVMSLVERAENLEMGPIILRVYWSIVDFYEFHFLPVLHSTHTVTQIKMYYNENAKPYVDQNITPLIAQLNNKFHIDAFFNHILSCLPERQIIEEEPVYTAKSVYTQVKTSSSSTIVPKTQSVPITPPAEPIKTVTITKSSSTKAVPASTTVAQSTKIAKEPTIAKSAEENNKDDDIMREVKSSVRPSATVKYVPDPKAAPDADKKEAIYCPTCNAAEEQLIVANTEKHIAPVRTDKHVIPVPTDNELFEVHQEVLDVPSQPSSPNKDFNADDDQVVIQAPIPKKETPTVKEEDIVYSIQTEAPTEEQIIIQAPIPSEKESSTIDEEEVYSIQTEVPTASDKEDIIFSIQTEASIETNIEDKLEKDYINDVDQKIIQDIRHEAKKDELKKEEPKKEEQIFVPPAIEKEELILESRGDEPINVEPVFVKLEEPKVEETVHYEEPIVKVEEPVQCEEPIDVVPVAQSNEHSPVINIKKPLAKQQIEVPVEQ